MHCAQIYNASQLRIEGFFDLSGTKSLGAFLPAGFKFSLQSDAMTLPLTNEFRDELNLQCTTQLRFDVEEGHENLFPSVFEVFLLGEFFEVWP